MASRNRLWVLIAAVLVAAGLGGYAAVKLDKSTATCQQLNALIAETNTRGAVLQNFLITAAQARERGARVQRRANRDAEAHINEAVAKIWRVDASQIDPVARLGC